KVSVNSAALARPELLDELARVFGAQCVVLAIDAKRTRESWEAYVAGGRTPTGRDAVEWAREGVGRGAGEVLLTSMDRGGTQDGYDLELLRAISGAVDVPVIASGGAGEPEHLVDGLEAGADAALCASIFHYGRYTIGEVKAQLAEAGVALRRGRPPRAGGGAMGREGLVVRLDEPDRVARDVAQAGVDAVGAVGRLLGELDAALGELLILGATIVGLEEDAARGALRQDLGQLLARVVVEHRWA